MRNFLTIVNKMNPLLGIAALTAMMTATQAQSWDWSYSYRTVNSTNALDHVVEQSNMKRTSEGNITYWNPTVNGQEARLTQKFVFPKPTVTAFLNIDYIYIANFSGTSYGSGSLWGSKNGVDWIQLLNAPRPDGIAEGYSYSTNLPTSLMGTTELWIQARLLTKGWNSMAQFLRYDTNARTNNAFDLKVNYGNTLIAGGSNGSISGNASPYFPNATATLIATPSPGYLFTGWTGDASSTDNPLSFVMNADKTITATFSPDTNDSDGDKWTNYEEIVIHGTNPTLPDTDDDTVKDSKDAFPLDPTETLDTDGDAIGDNLDTDDDGDGYSDVDEINIYLTNPKRADSDGDGLTDPVEIQIHLTNPNLADSDSDGLSDSAEVNIHGTLPKVRDTDGDGFLDGYEVLTGKLPLDPLSKPALVAEARTAIEFTFPSALGKSYRIENSLDLATWTTVESGILGNGGQVQRFYSTHNVPKRYFRVEEDGQ
jgi:uncharacterized repeat protein (TIGR02543 family)